MSGCYQKICTVALVLLASGMSQAAPPDMACVSNGVFVPLFRSQTDLKEVPVKSFYLDVVPVTNEKFLEFVRANPRWQRAQVKRIFADEKYLLHWAGDLELGTNALPDQPVVWVSWFAAKAFGCKPVESVPDRISVGGLIVPVELTTGGMNDTVGGILSIDTLFEAAEDALVPIALVAVTVKV